MDKKNKTLNIIYFVDSNKTRSLEISLTKIKFIAAGIAVVACWSVTSVAIIFSLAKENSTNSEMLKKSQAAVFEYQSRYDGVYEKAYPNQTIKIANIEKVNEQEKKQEITQNQSKNEEPEVKPIEIKQDPMTVSVNGLNIEKAEIISKNTQAKLSFVMRNSNKEKKAKGYVWAKIKLETENKVIFVSSPPVIELDQEGNALNQTKAHSYSVKNYKKTDLDIRIDPNISGTISEIEMFTLDENKEIKKYSFKTNFSIKSLAMQNPNQKENSLEKEKF